MCSILGGLVKELRSIGIDIQDRDSCSSAILHKNCFLSTCLFLAKGFLDWLTW